MSLYECVPLGAVVKTPILFRDESEKIGEDDSNLRDKMATQTLLIEKRLKTSETKHCLNQRWEPECVQYQIVKQTFTTKTRNNLLVRIKDLARERWVLLALKAKYAGKCVVS